MHFRDRDGHSPEFGDEALTHHTFYKKVPLRIKNARAAISKKQPLTQDADAIVCGVLGASSLGAAAPLSAEIADATAPQICG